MKSAAERQQQNAFYHSAEWKATREYILMRDNYLCCHCGKPATEVHHIIHLNAANIYDPAISMNPDNLISLCRDCHQKQHRQDQAAGHMKQPNVLPSYHFDENGNIVPDKPMP